MGKCKYSIILVIKVIPYILNWNFECSCKDCKIDFRHSNGSVGGTMNVTSNISPTKVGISRLMG